MSDVIIVGATGLVGANLVASNRFPSILGIARTRPNWWPKSKAFTAGDVFQNDFCWSKLQHRASRVVFLAFPTNIDVVEKYTDKDVVCLLENFTRFLNFAQKNQSPVLFVSSDAVLWGASVEERSPSCRPNPINRYGSLKAECENLLLASKLPMGSCVVRCTPIGIHPYSAGHGLLSSMIERAKTTMVKGFIDSLITPVTCEIFINFVGQWLDAVACNLVVPPIIHLGSSSPVSKYDVIKAAFSRYFSSGEIEPVKFDPNIFKVHRVADQSFSCTKLSWFNQIEVADVLSTI